MNISGVTNWELATLNLSPGMHTLKWVFSKDPVLANGQDAGWIDEVRIHKYGPTYLIGGHIGVGIPIPKYPLDVEGYVQSHGYCITGRCGNTWRRVVEMGTTNGYNVFLG